MAVTTFHLTWPEVVQLGRNSLRYSLAEAPLKERMLRDLGEVLYLPTPPQVFWSTDETNCLKLPPGPQVNLIFFSITPSIFSLKDEPEGGERSEAP